MKTWLKDKLAQSQDFVSSKFSVGFASLTGFLAEQDLLQWLEGITKSAANDYDRALDLEYLRSNIGGGYHRLFDGGHDIFSAWDRVQAASNHDTFSEEVIGYLSALWKDVTTPMGLPFQTLDKANFDAFARTLSELNIPGLDREYLADLVSFDAFEILSTTLGAVAAIFALKRDDQIKLAEILGSLGITAIIAANPIMGIFVILLAGYSYVVKKQKLSLAAASQGAVLTGLSCALFSLLGLPLLIELGLVIVVSSLTKKYVLKNDELHQLVIRHWKALPEKLSQLKPETFDEIIARLKISKQTG